MKKTLYVCLALMLLVSLLLSACTNNESSKEPVETSTNKEAKGGEEEASNLTPPGEFPIVKEKVTLKVLVKQASQVEDYETNWFTQYLEEKTNVHIDCEVVPTKNADTKLNLMLSSGDYPDIIMNFDVSPSQQMIYGKQGIFLPLNDLIDNSG